MTNVLPLCRKTSPDQENRLKAIELLKAGTRVFTIYDEPKEYYEFVLNLDGSLEKFKRESLPHYTVRYALFWHWTGGALK
jgi:hypothetical protein